jgi:UDP-N-acetylglucosamine--N-acetylmuramyl-(pentapeptide) pyrophosphoryl-undecaprenol N-acetylglucosamine transferase
MELKKVIISGGGTGGHIFPAVAIADKVKEHHPNAEILFIGAEGKMEMEKVPAAGYEIVGLPIRGFQRKFTWSNFLLPFKILSSMWKARKIIKKFQPDVVVGVGGYASGPTLQMATMLKIPTVIQEQNGFAGKTNKILGQKVNKVCVAYENMEQFFPKEKIVFTGNPVRKNIVDIEGKQKEAFSFFNLDPNKKTLLVVGGSLGARTFNNCLVGKIKLFQDEGVQLIWQCGKTDYSSLKEATRNIDLTGIVLTEFITRMDLAYAAADVIVSRAGAIAVSELSIIGKPMILIPSPNVAEDHQTKNAMALVKNDAAILIKDSEAREDLIERVISLAKDENQQRKLSEAIAKMGKPNATKDIVSEILNVI